MRDIDLETWDRRDYFRMYLGTDFPYINIGADLDISALVAFAERNGLSSYLTMIFAAHHTAEGIANFQYRIKDGRPVTNDRMGVTFTHIPDGTDLFVNITMDFADDLLAFHAQAREEMAAQGNDLGLAKLLGRLDIIGYSAIPWVQYTHFVRTIRVLGVDSNPKISWGKYFRQGERTLVPFSVQVHHGLMDGIHVGRYFEELQRYVHTQFGE